MNNRDLFLDLMEEIDTRHLDRHIKRNTETKTKKIMRYVAAAGIYAAACAAVILLMPLIIGHTGVEPPANGPAGPIYTETNALPGSSATTESIEKPGTDLTRETIEAALEKLRLETIADGVPLFMSVEDVNLLTAENYGPHKREFNNYNAKAYKIFENLFEDLPDKCSLYCHAFDKEFAHVSTVLLNPQFLVLDPDDVPDGEEEDLSLYLFMRFLRLYATQKSWHESFQEDHTDEMSELEERFGDIGTVVVHIYGRWYFLDTVNDELERIELFPGYVEIEDKFAVLIGIRSRQEFEEMLDPESKAILSEYYATEQITDEQ